MAKVFQDLASHREIQKVASGLMISLARDYAPRPTDHDYIRRSDTPWVRRFALAGGQVVISGDNRMRLRQAEREALVKSNLVVFFFASEWNNTGFFDKSAMLLHWWRQALEVAATAPRPSFWRIPATWASATGIVQVPHSDLKLERIERQKAAGPVVRAGRAKQRDASQTVISWDDGTKDKPKPEPA